MSSSLPLKWLGSSVLSATEGSHSSFFAQLMRTNGSWSFFTRKARERNPLHSRNEPVLRAPPLKAHRGGLMRVTGGKLDRILRNPLNDEVAAPPPGSWNRAASTQAHRVYRGGSPAGFFEGCMVASDNAWD